MSTPPLPEAVPEIDVNPVSLLSLVGVRGWKGCKVTTKIYSLARICLNVKAAVVC